ncbi:MAG TPA: hypothetical protein PKI28_12500 [Accumulibacter sp.]|nr:hypothetical protein [Accumulibacter sp.]
MLKYWPESTGVKQVILHGTLCGVNAKVIVIDGEPLAPSVVQSVGVPTGFRFRPQIRSIDPASCGREFL